MPPAKEPKQIWFCNDCAYRYESEVSIISITCSRRHKAKNMALISGEKVASKSKKTMAKPIRMSSKPKHPPTEPEAPVQSKPKVGKLTNPQLLLEAFGIKE